MTLKSSIARSLLPVAFGSLLLVVAGLLLFPQPSIERLPATPASEDFFLAEVEEGVHVGQRLPAFQWVALDGSLVTPERLWGCPSVLYFSSVTCIKCGPEVQELANLKAQYRDLVQLVYVDVIPETDTLADLERYARHHGGDRLLWTLDNAQQPSLISFQIYELGTVIVLDANGIIVFRAASAVGSFAFNQTLKAFLDS